MIGSGYGYPFGYGAAGNLSLGDDDEYTGEDHIVRGIDLMR